MAQALEPNRQIDELALAAAALQLVDEQLDSKRLAAIRRHGYRTTPVRLPFRNRPGLKRSSPAVRCMRPGIAAQDLGKRKRGCREPRIPVYKALPSSLWTGRPFVRLTIQSAAAARWAGRVARWRAQADPASASWRGRPGQRRLPETHSGIGSRHGEAVGCSRRTLEMDGRRWRRPSGSPAPRIATARVRFRCWRSWPQRRRLEGRMESRFELSAGGIAWDAWRVWRHRSAPPAESRPEARGRPAFGHQG